MLPCPFCGGAAKIETRRQWGLKIYCEQCRAEMKFYREDMMPGWDREDRLYMATSMWNDRVMPNAQTLATPRITP